MENFEKADFVSTKDVLSKIIAVRGKRVLLDRDLAELYDVSTKALNQAVRRNIVRFPDDFMFQLTDRERTELVTNCDRFLLLRHSTSNPTVFTEQGVAMLSSVLKSERAVLVNIQIMRAFVSLRRDAGMFVVLKRKIESMERRYDAQFSMVFSAIKELLDVPEKPKKRIGFHSDT